MQTWAAAGFRLCATLRDGTAEAEGKEQGAQRVCLLDSCLLRILSGSNKTKLSYLAKLGATHRASRKKTRPVDLVERVFKVLGQETSVFVGVVAPHPPSDGVDDGLASAGGSKPELRWVRVPRHVSVVGRAHP